MPASYRLFLVEDDERRIDRFHAWVPDDVRIVVARSAGRAIGTLQRDGHSTYAGIMLDHDLHQQIVTPADARLSGNDLVDVVIRKIHRDVPILIHSMNPAGAQRMAERLRSVGFWVTYFPFAHLNEAGLRKWVDEAKDLWSDRMEG